MRADPRGIAESVALGTALAGIGYTAFAITRLRAFGRRIRERAPAAVQPTVTVLKPVSGVEPGLEENLRSFCEQDYPEYRVVFGVPRAEDAALPVLQRLAAAFQERAEIVVGDGVSRARNPKIANLMPMLARARGEILVIADSDMRVTPHHLEAVVAPFADPLVGAVTTLYRGEPADDGLASMLGAMWISEQFAPSALVANALEPLTYTFGATMAVRRTALDAIGGIAALGDELADDHALGQLVAAASFTVVLAATVAGNVVSESGLRTLFDHELRWARTIRSVRPASYPGILLTYPVPLALVYLALARHKRRALVVLTAAVALRLALHGAAHVALGGTRPAARRLIPLRDLLGVAVWAAGLFGRRVRWRDEVLRTS